MANKNGSKFKNMALWVLTIALAGMLFMSGAAKLMFTDPLPANYLRWGYPLWFLIVVGSAEVAGAAALLFPKVAAFGAVWLGLIMIGAVSTHLASGEYFQALVPFVLADLLFVVAYARRESILAYLPGRVGRKPLPHRPQ